MALLTAILQKIFHIGDTKSFEPAVQKTLNSANNGP